MYGIPKQIKRIVKYDPINDITSFLGEEPDGYFCCSGGALARDGCIYAMTFTGQVLRIDTTNNVHCFVENSVFLAERYGYIGWSDAILGIDGCMYLAIL